MRMTLIGLGVVGMVLLGMGTTMTACRARHVAPVAPQMTVSPSMTPTMTPTPHCGFVNVNVDAVNLAISPTPDATVTVIQMGTPVATSIWNTPVPSVTPNMTPAPYGGQVRVLRDLADWQSYYGTQTPPVDFSTKMILQTYVENDCFGRASFQQVCEDSDQVTATLFQENAILGCNMVMFRWISAEVDRTNLPVVWQVVTP